MSIEAELGAIEGAAKRLMHIGQQQPASVPTFTPAARIRPAQSSQPEAQVSLLSTIHKDLSNAGSALQHAWPIISAVVNNPLLDAIAEAELGLVLSPGEVQAVVAFVKAIEAERRTQAEGQSRASAAVVAAANGGGIRQTGPQQQVTA